MESIYGNVLPSFTFFLDFFHLSFRYKLIVCPESTCLMEFICQPVPLIDRCKSLFFYIGKVHSPQYPQQLPGGTGRLQSTLQQPEQQQRQKTGKKMRFYPVFPAHIDRTGSKICRHRPEAVFYLPSSFTHLQDL